MNHAIVTTGRFTSPLSIKLDEAVTGLAGEIRITIEPIDTKKVLEPRELGKLKGKLVLSEDFNAPLDDFKEYM